MKLPGARQRQTSALLLSPQRNLREALLTGLAIFAISSSTLVVSYFAEEQSLRTQIRSNLRDLAGLAATTLDTSPSRGVLAPGLLDSATYRQATEPLLRLRREVPDLYYAYTLVPSATGFRFGVDSSAFIRNPGDDTPVALPGELYDDAPPGVERAFRSGQVVVSAEPYTDKWGSFISAFAPLRDSQGQTVGLLGLDLSIGSLEGLLRPLRQTLALALVASAALAAVVALGRWRSLQSRGRAFAAMAEAEEKSRQAANAADQANRAKSSFLAAMSHELRTPLNGVIGLSEILLGTSLTARQRECVETVKGSGESLLRLVSDVLDMAQLESGALEPEATAFHLVTVLEQEVARLRRQAQAKGMTLDLVASPDLPATLVGDPLRLAQILRHLVGNAIKFSERGTVTIHARLGGCDGPGEPGLEIAVQDSGQGLDRQTIERLFQPFAQVDGSTSRLQEGAGMGLALCRGLVEVLGGELGVESTPELGSRFTLKLPLQKTVAGTAPQPWPQGDGEETVPADNRKGRDRPLQILMAEDNSVNARVCLLMLERLGYTARVARDGEQAVELQARHDPDVILMDLRMPHLDGLEATRRIRADRTSVAGGATPRPWIIAMTANSQARDRGEALESGMNDFLTKPMTLASLAQALERAHRALQP